MQAGLCRASAPNIEFSVDQSLCALTARVALAGLQGPFEGYDSTPTEVYFLGKTIQPFLDSIGLNRQLRTRRDVDQLVEFMPPLPTTPLVARSPP